MGWHFSTCECLAVRAGDVVAAQLEPEGAEILCDALEARAENVLQVRELRDGGGEHAEVVGERVDLAQHALRVRSRLLLRHPHYGPEVLLQTRTDMSAHGFKEKVWIW